MPDRDSEYGGQVPAQEAGEMPNVPKSSGEQACDPEGPRPSPHRSVPTVNAQQVQRYGWRSQIRGH